MSVKTTRLLLREIKETVPAIAEGRIYSPIIATFTFVWPTLFAAIWSSAHGLSLAVWLSRQSAKLWGRWEVKAWHMNAFFIGFYPVPLLLNVPCVEEFRSCLFSQPDRSFSLAAVQMQRLWSYYPKIKANLQPSIDSWQIGDKLVIKPDLIALFLDFGKAGLSFFDDYSASGRASCVV
jgi:hypothetical protein